MYPASLEAVRRRDAVSVCFKMYHSMFLLLNFVLVAVALCGFRWLLEGRMIGRILSLVVALAGADAATRGSLIVNRGLVRPSARDVELGQSIRSMTVPIPLSR